MSNRKLQPGMVNPDGYRDTQNPAPGDLCRFRLLLLKAHGTLQFKYFLSGTKYLLFQTCQDNQMALHLY